MLENIAMALVAFGLLLIPAMALKVVYDDIKDEKADKKPRTQA